MSSGEIHFSAISGGYVVVLLALHTDLLSPVILYQPPGFQVEIESNSSFITQHLSDKVVVVFN